MTPRSYKGWSFVLYWAGVSIFLPLLVIGLVCWIAVGLGSKNAFIDFFGSGDLIPICALLLLGVWLDILNSKDDKKHWLILVSEICFMFIGIGSLVAYGFTKSFGISVTTTATSAMDPQKLANEQGVLRLVGVISWCFCIYAVIHAAVVKSILVYKDQIKEEGSEP